MALEHALDPKARNRPEANTGVLSRTDQPFTVLGKSDGLGVSSVGIEDNGFAGYLGRSHEEALPWQ
jgi:hypothetical protein